MVLRHQYGLRYLTRLLTPHTFAQPSVVTKTMEISTDPHECRSQEQPRPECHHVTEWKQRALKSNWPWWLHSPWASKCSQVVTHTPGHHSDFGGNIHITILTMLRYSSSF